MKIQTSSPLHSGSVRKSDRSRTGGGSFADSLSVNPSPGGSVTGGGQVGGVNSLLALQEVEDWTGDKRRAIERGEDLLDQLEAIRVGLLMGRIPGPQIERLMGRLKERRQSLLDPGLAETIAEIELRAAVELAKLEVRSAT